MLFPKPYITFPGTARAALTRYQEIFGGTLQLHTFAEFSRNDGNANQIAHGTLDGIVCIYGSDAGTNDETLWLRGMMFSLLGTDAAQHRRWFDALAENGKVLDPLQQRPWGAWDGQVEDGFGIRWLVGYETPAQ